MTAPGAHITTIPAHIRRRLAAALENGLLPETPTPITLESVLGLRHGAEQITSDLEALARLGIRGKAASGWIRTIEQAIDSAPAIDLVWSGPEVLGLHARDTSRVYEELLRNAQLSVWISTYAYFDGPRAFADLAHRLETMADLRVALLLNIQRTRGDTTDPEHLVRRFADRFWGTDWPGATRPDVYYDPRSLELDGPTGVLHAKALVVDDESVFITSANLTEAAFDRNIELGLLTRDRRLAASITTHFQTLIDTKLLRPLPSA
ncbi:DISARM system phospholipase D-like protein DrmC [Candidatus Poriferisocius sp.]|uniref:DISARM system phospholipase D-like protein DrmC n=1 Tax=Candidatus Poriferisocius sp. TaxID=3101276 RepID=UPI003B5C2FB9